MAGSVRSTGPTLLPNVTCPTTFGIQHPQAEAPTPRVGTSVPAALASGLSAYTDRTGVQTVVAPSGWHCFASIAADGNGVLIVVPPGESTDPVPQPFLPDMREAVVSIETSACQGCRYELVCPLVADPSDAAAQGIPCPRSRPPAEQTTQLSATAAAFEDPPDTVGDGFPSGGPYPANGVVMHHGPVPQPGSETGLAETCSLPAGQHATCTAILNEFLRRYE